MPQDKRPAATNRVDRRAAVQRIRVKYFTLFNAAVFPSHKDSRTIRRAYKKHHYIFICILIFLRGSVFSDNRLSSVPQQRCSVENYSVV